jgi:hypothetical protein
MFFRFLEERVGVRERSLLGEDVWQSQETKSNGNNPGPEQLVHPHS